MLHFFSVFYIFKNKSQGRALKSLRQILPYTFYNLSHAASIQILHYIFCLTQIRWIFRNGGGGGKSPHLGGFDFRGRRSIIINLGEVKHLILSPQNAIFSLTRGNYSKFPPAAPLFHCFWYMFHLFNLLDQYFSYISVNTRVRSPHLGGDVKDMFSN